ncbi:hypothetical protein Tco_0897706 [Tanacetum coccineum]
MYVDGKIAYVDKMDAYHFNVEVIHRFLEDLGYDHEELTFYHFRMPNKSLDYGLRPLSYDDDIVSLIKLVETFKMLNVNVEDEHDTLEEQANDIVYEEHVIDEVEVNMEVPSFSVGEKDVDPTVKPHLDVT